MERRSYPGALTLVLPRLFLLVLLTIVPMFCAGVYMDWTHGPSWRGTTMGVGGLVLLAICFRWVYRDIPCLMCKQTHLAFAKSKCKDRWYLLTCRHCGIEWEMGIGDSNRD